MASVKAAEIAEALFRHLAIMPDLLPVAYPNVSFSPPADGRFLAASFMPNRLRGEMVRFEDRNEATGLLQVAVYWPLNAGIVAPQRVADAVITHFARGAEIAGNGFSVRVIEDPWSSTPLTDDSRAMIPVTIPWRVF